MSSFDYLCFVGICMLLGTKMGIEFCIYLLGEKPKLFRNINDQMQLINVLYKKYKGILK
jgi:hypothetical protein